MKSVGRICLYCSKPIAEEDRIALCDRCFTAHHEACWDRNGRCSTFRCAGLPQTMRGDDLRTAVQIAMERANEQPLLCPFCNGKVFAGLIQGKCTEQAQDGAARQGLVFVSRRKPNPHKDWFGRHFLDKMLGNKSWQLAGAHIRARSCGRCRRVFIWSLPIEQIAAQDTEEPGAEEKCCPHCGDALWHGSIDTNSHGNYHVRFVCDEPPDFHSDWFGHNILDRWLLNRWNLPIKALPAHSCPVCQYTEIAGKPIYRFS